MGIKPRFSQSDVRNALLEQSARLKRAVIQRFLMVGEMCLTEARTNKTYRDVTGNLTASMGYVVVDHGHVVHFDGFDSSASATQGPAHGRSLANELAGKFNNGIALIMVAGMEYAAAVETRGKVVLASAELLAENELPKMMKRLIKNLGKTN